MIRFPATAGCAALVFLGAAAAAGPTSRPVASTAPVEPFEGSDASVPPTQIDALVTERLRRQGIPPARLCSDAVFVRRAYLDVIGALPTAREARAFIEDRAPGKRRELIDRLLQRDEFADYWAMKWSDVLRLKAEFPINLWPNGAQAYYRWVHSAVRDNKPYDRFTRELLTASGSNFRVPEANFYRAVQGREPAALADAFALTFLGARADRWPAERRTNLAAFFSEVGYKATAEWKEEIVFWDPGKAATRPSRSFVLPDGTSIDVPPDRDPREALADWLVSPKNPALARAAVNRAWFWLVGRGIVHEPDDLRPDNPPSNPELLAYLEREFVASHYDFNRLFRLILNSRTYQLSSVPRSDDPAAAPLFASYPLRRLDAEVLADALCQITGSTERYSSPIPEPFTFVPDGQRSVALPDASITSSFLELFGRPGRDTGLLSERNDRTTADQRLHLLNSTHVQRKLEDGRALQAVLRSNGKPRDVITTVYLTLLSRFPTEREIGAVEAYARSGAGSRREAMTDLAWALVNSPEFLYRH